MNINEIKQKTFIKTPFRYLLPMTFTMPLHFRTPTVFRLQNLVGQLLVLLLVERNLLTLCLNGFLFCGAVSTRLLLMLDGRLFNGRWQTNWFWRVVVVQQVGVTQLKRGKLEYHKQLVFAVRSLAFPENIKLFNKNNSNFNKKSLFTLCVSSTLCRTLSSAITPAKSATTTA